jgi:solute carrier family 25 phosphate transporter 23/24/25/41
VAVSPVPPPVVPAAAVISGGETALNTLKALSAGAFAGALSRTITSPLERLKVLKQVQSHNSKYDGVGRALVRMYREEGWRAYWKGNGTNVARIAPFSAIQFVSFDFYKGVSERLQMER